MGKISRKTRLFITNLNVNNLGKMLKRSDFEQVKRNVRRLFAVIEMTFDPVQARQMGVTDETLPKDEISQTIEKEYIDLNLSVPFQ